MNAGRTARERVRAELTREITDIARRQLATEGAAGLSLRAVAREMGMVSSAIYRYFPSRDDLLTALIIDGYNAIGDAVEAADRACPPVDHGGRWLTVCRTLREWALAHPHEYALLYGSPVPGYQAPEDTIGPAIRDVVVYGGIMADAHRSGVLDPAPGFPSPHAPSWSGDAERLRRVMPGLPDDVVARAVVAWTALFGAISLELFGQFANTILDPGSAFEHSMTCMGRFIGFAYPADA
ncbi:TetR/AcrR family transcriptional regulator [Spongiactinospora sp. TRM90649]|uniref:TetR/AcrR family transcriptional regulator n=1 Tax=Spongiactinospora sp. TRM90649 TaxID=3031114 RepID=UPI0023F98B8B|nr:TetR/AcrR family transcriptional regulator [Spongiactinospora sp. TRM90649]MDF5754140.1 TetR/AcrR family transcriptional regulator [Spongiactinospora sp. TRM90649]